MILVFKPFKAGDFIEALGYSGTVTDVNIVSTKLLTTDNRRVVLPNGALSNGNINNYNYQTSTWSVSDGFYLRLKNVSVGYNLPEDVLKRTGFISGLRIYFTGTDLWEYTKVLDGWDPEAKSAPSSTSRYPFMRGYAFGVNLTF